MTPAPEPSSRPRPPQGSIAHGPLRVFERLAQAPDARVGAFAVLAAGALWAVFCLVLARAGHAPSRVLVPLPRASYYFAQALFVLPLMVLLWLFCSLVAVRAARALGGTGSLCAALNTLGVALATPLITLFLLPEVVAYAGLGFSVLGRLLRVTAPLSFVATLALAALAMRASYALPRGKSWLAGAAGVLAQAAVGSVLLR